MNKVDWLRVMLSIVIALVFLLAGAVSAFASTGGESLRRIDTADINQADDIRPVEDHSESGPGSEGGDDAGEEHEANAKEDDGETEEHKLESLSEESEDEHAKDGKEEHAEPAEGESGEEKAHHPAWMIPGWQSIFTILAVVYFALGVTLLPRIMAKEDH